jgi:hypothetical protein
MPIVSGASSTWVLGSDASEVLDCVFLLQKSVHVGGVPVLEIPEAVAAVNILCPLKCLQYGISGSTEHGNLSTNAYSTSVR